MVIDRPGAELGAYLRELRQVAALTLREVQDRTGDAVKNGYLSQIETGHIARPSPDVLWHLAQAYGVEYNDLLARAGHRSVDTAARSPDTLAGIPLSAIADLDDDDKQTIVEYIEFLRAKKKRAST